MTTEKEFQELNTEDPLYKDLVEITLSTMDAAEKLAGSPDYVIAHFLGALVGRYGADRVNRIATPCLKSVTD